MTLDHIDPHTVARFGGKACNCARLLQRGFPVPNGLVVPAGAADDHVGEWLEHAWLAAQPADARFAVRSSGTEEDAGGHSFAGIHETRLDVARADLAPAVVRCRRSGQTPQAAAYRAAIGLPPRGAVIPVLIQPMIESAAAGVAFTIDPITGRDGHLIVNASKGRGDTIVNGQVNPDEYRVRARDLTITSTRVGENGDGPALDSRQVIALASLLLEIEKEYGAPQDVEWCHDGHRFWILQSRPITTGPAHGADIEWTRANLAEVLPDLACPQVLAAYAELLNAAERDYMGALLAPDDVLGPMVRMFHGRLYFNLSQLRQICRVTGTPAAVVLKSLGHDGDIRPEDEVPARVPLAARLRVLPAMLRVAGFHLRARRLVAALRDRTRATTARLDEADLTATSDEQVLEEFDRQFSAATREMRVVLMLGGVLFHEMPVRRLCSKAGFPYERLIYPQLAAGERSVSAQQAVDLVALADAARREPIVLAWFTRQPFEPAAYREALGGTAFLAGFDAFLREYGHRGRYESDWSLPRYHEDPSPLLLAMRAHLLHPPDGDARTHADRAREADAAWREFRRRLTWWRRLQLPLVRTSIRKIKQYYVWREACRSDLTRMVGAQRRWHLALADRLVARGWIARRDEYFLLRFGEMMDVLQGRAAASTLAELVADREAERARQARIAMPLLMRESDLPRLVRAAGVTGEHDERELTGLTVSGGCVEGDVVVLRDPGEIDRMKRGAILVARATDPSWTPLFTLASGVIVEVGGVLSHASTIAREYGLPALANVKHATRRLRTGDRVQLDADGGVVRKISHRRASTHDEPVQLSLGEMSSSSDGGGRVGSTDDPLGAGGT